MIDKKQIEKLEDILMPEAQKIVLVAHANPDGDALGSILAWQKILALKGHEVFCVVPNRYPAFLEWMTDIDSIIIFMSQQEEVKKLVDEAEIIFCLDFNNLSRIDELGKVIASNDKAVKVLIDHHLEPSNEFDLSISCPESSSTSYLLYKLIEQLYGTEVIDCPIAEALWVGMMTDTGNFSFGNLTPDTFRAAAVLVEKGVNPAAMNRKVYSAYSEGRMRLLGYVISEKMEVMGRYGVAYIALQEHELHKFNFVQGDSEGFVNFPLTIKQIKMSAMFLQTDKCIRVSLRSIGEIDVNIFARKYFNGGGHKNAAGGSSDMSMSQTISYFERSVEEFFLQKG